MLTTGLAHLHCLILIAQRRCSGISIYARRRDGTWGFEGGNVPNTNFTLISPDFLLRRPTS